jgi:hypothetical protein
MKRLIREKINQFYKDQSKIKGTPSSIVLLEVLPKKRKEMPSVGCRTDPRVTKE